MRVRSIFAVLVIAFMLGGQPASLEAEPASVIVVLDPIDNPDGDGTYTISWREVTAERIFLPLILRTADPGQSGPVTTINTSSPSHTPDQVTYTLEEDDSPIFDSAQVVYQGPLASVELTDRAEGVYYYRVKRDDTSWSNHQPAVVHVQSLACQTFVEDFTDTDYCDVENTTADWDTNEGNLKLGNTLLPALREGLSDLSAVYVPVTGKVYVLGGDDGSFGHQRIREFDPATGKVSELSAMLSFGARKRTSAVYASETGKIYVFGGSWGSSSYPSDDVVEFDPVADQARALSVKLPSEREYTSATYVPETGKAYVFGGHGESGWLDRIVEVRFDYYAWAQQAQSLEVDHWSIGVLSATLSADQILSGQAVSYALSNDGGTSWEDVTLDVDHVFSDTTGADLRWRSTLSSDGKTTPEIERLSISYCPNRTMDAPVAPSLGPITNTNTDGYYPLAWSPVPQASVYVVEESSAANFRNAVVMFVGAQTDLWITRRELGPYYYRVRAWNARGNGDWSDEQHTIVTQRIAAPALDPIENGDGWASYVLTWEEIGSGVSYTLQRDVSPSFPSPATVYEGGDNSSWQAVSELGTYYYRVKAADVGFESAWSSEQSVEVAQLCPEPGHYAGEPDVSFDVTDNCQVCDFDITVPFGFLQYCRIRPSSCANITSNNFGFASIEIGAIFVITGTFDSPMDAIGGYSVSMCEDQLILPPSEGTWEASK